MQYEQIVEQSIRYIKAHIDESLSPKKIADHVGYSTFHFCRLFSLVKGLPVMEYVRKYRLATARVELSDNQRIIDVAAQVGYQSASGFAKSFKQEFGYSPTAYKVRMSDSNNQFVKNIRDVLEPPRLVDKEAFCVAGYGIAADIAYAHDHQGAAFWASSSELNLEATLYQQLQPAQHGEVGLWLSQQEASEAIYLFGVIVTDFSLATAEMTVAEIPRTTYAVFTTPPVNNLTNAETYGKDPLSIAVKDTWRYIFSEWFTDSPYQLNEAGLAFEYYDERCHPCEQAVMEIYIPVKKS